MKNTIIQPIFQAISDAAHITITTHSNPDGDAIGSSLALSSFLQKLGKKADIIIPNAFPDFLEWMPGSGDILNWDRQQAKCQDVINNTNLIFALDYNALHRLDKLQYAISTKEVPKVLIDHHISPSDEFNHLYSDIRVSSTAELVYRFIKDMGHIELMDEDISVNLFVGIMTDTGSFSFSCNRPEVFEITADLIRRGVNPELAHRQVYDTYSENRMRLLGHGLSDRMKVLNEYACAYIYLTKEDLKVFRFRIGDTEGIVNYPLSIKGINLSVLFTEKHDKVRMSFRSKGSFSVNDFVRAHFDGGGHRNAAGGNSYDSLQVTLDKFEALLPGYQNSLINA